MNQDTFKPFVQELVDAARPANDEEASKSQKAAALVVNSIGSMVTAKTGARKTQFSEAVDTLGNALQAARSAKQNERKETAKPETKKTLAELLAESAAE
jgi:hypothetical protein